MGPKKFKCKIQLDTMMQGLEKLYHSLSLT